MPRAVQLNAALRGREGDWVFIGVPKWKEDADGVIYPPVWSYPNFDPDPTQVPNVYAHELAREDYALISTPALSDTDVSVEYKCTWSAVAHGGIVFRALDSARCYVLDIQDLYRKGQYYEYTLWKQDATGYREKLASAMAPHSIVPEHVLQAGAKTRADWEEATPDWVTVRVQASGTYMRVSVDGAVLFDVRNRSYQAGCVGLATRGAVYFRNLRVSGVPAQLPGQWSAHEGELPRFTYPGGKQAEGFNAYPVVCGTRDGATLVAWGHTPIERRTWGAQMIVLTRSDDGCRTWSPLRPIFDAPGARCAPRSLFEYRDGALSCILQIPPRDVVIVSRDGGRTWSEPRELLIAGKPLVKPQWLYSPMMRLSDGTVVMCGYDADVVSGGDEGSNADRLDRSFLLRSGDDGYTWEAPTYFDPANFDHNECMVAETAPGKLVAFMRTLAAPYMWTSRSQDGGKTWTPLVQSNVAGECPYLLRHSSGALVMASRGSGTFVKLSFDGGESWPGQWRISPASAMVGMTELPDGRVFIAMHEGYRVPGYVRGQTFRVTPNGPVAAD